MKTNKSQLDSSPHEALYEIILGGFIQQAVSVAAKLGIPDLLQSGPKHYEELANLTHTHAPSLYRLMRALSHLGIFKERDGHLFENDSLGKYLQTDSNGSLRNFAIMVGEQWHRDAWTNLLYAIRTGECAFENVHDQNIFSFLSENQEAGDVFNQAMSGFAADLNELVACYDFTSYQHVIDVGGGHGTFLEAILANCPHITGTLYDLPSVIKGAKQRYKEHNISERFHYSEGSFFEKIPTGGDLYTMKHVIHDWSDDEARNILTNCRRAIGASGRLVLIEALIDSEHASKLLPFTDLEMMVQITGKERTQQEFDNLLRSSGFQLTAVIPTPSATSIIEAKPI